MVTRIYNLWFIKWIININLKHKINKLSCQNLNNDQQYVFRLKRMSIGKYLFSYKYMIYL